MIFKMLKMRLKFKKPKKCKILIYDGTESTLIRKNLPRKSVEILWNRGELVHIPCLLRAISSPLNFLLKPRQAYEDAFIGLCRPRIIVTFIDNNPAFYRLKSRWPNVQTASIQNGFREINRQFREKFGDCSRVDVMFVQGLAIGKLLGKFIKGKIIPLGSLKNNFYVKENKKKLPRSILFLSQYREKPKNFSCFFKDGEKRVTYEEFYDPERRLLAYLQKYLAEKKQPLFICGCSHDSSKEEEKFFSDRIGSTDFEFLPQTHPFSSYRWIERADRIVFIDSTLGYEALARGKRAAAFPCRGKNWGSKTRTFGWPERLPDTGPFWANRLTRKSFQSVLHSVTNLSDRDWEKVLSQVMPSVS